MSHMNENMNKTHDMSHMKESAWDKIFDSMENITEPYDFTLLPKDQYLDNFQHHLNVKYADYIGSQTSPPCRHNVRWIVSYCPHGFTVSTDQVPITC